MITVDPERDIPDRLVAYILSFFDDGHALRTVLSTVAERTMLETPAQANRLPALVLTLLGLNALG